VLLRPGLLKGTVVLLAGAGGPSDGIRGVVGGRAAELGAAVLELDQVRGEEDAVEQAVAITLDSSPGPLGTLVVEGGECFEQALTQTGDGLDALRGTLDGSWNVVRAVANRAFIPAPDGGKIVLVAPAPAAGGEPDPGRDGTRAGLENMARTLSIEWARHAIRLTALLPAPGVRTVDVADLALFLASPAGDYYSGCRFDVGSGTPVGGPPVRALPSGP
jgi:NAD(P)-dependent dehydrogenase (short-subunit alcohol dehydrogenase family)